MSEVLKIVRKNVVLVLLHVLDLLCELKGLVYINMYMYIYIYIYDLLIHTHLYIPLFLKK